MAGNNEYQTPYDTFHPWHKRFRFTVDAAASDVNTLLPRYYTKEDSAFDHTFQDERAWCNPPYFPGFQLYKWVEKAYLSARNENALWVMLLPPSIDTRWFHDFVWDRERRRERDGVELTIPQGRIRFIDPKEPEKESPPTGNLFVVFFPGNWWHDGR